MYPFRLGNLCNIQKKKIVTHQWHTRWCANISRPPVILNERMNITAIRDDLDLLSLGIYVQRFYKW